jgi:hypothetical protein
MEAYSIRRIADRMEIQDCIHKFARAVDRRDWALARSVYHEDAVDDHGIYNGPAENFIEFTKKRHETVLMSMHHVSNITIEFDGDNRALVESYVFAWQSLSPSNADMRAAVDKHTTAGDQPLEMLMIARYVDVFTYKNEAWRIQYRQLVYESSMKVIPEATGPDVGNTMKKGRRDHSDPLYILRGELFQNEK